jgi:glycosyltransferase involved in cell wall biosynthesis
LDKLKRIAIITSGHSSYDDRLFWRFGISLQQNGFDVTIISSVEELNAVDHGIRFKSFAGISYNKKDKISRFVNLLLEINPKLIICCEPLCLLAAYKYRLSSRKKINIIYDVTEYYPHNAMLKSYSGIKWLIMYLKYFIIHIYTSNLCNELFIGEINKSRIFNYIAPFKKKILLGYYPPLKFFRFVQLKFSEPITLCYSGEISISRGIHRYLNLLDQLSRKFTNIRFKGLIIGMTNPDYNLNQSLKELSSIKNLEIEYIERVKYDKLGESLSKAHFLVDLRDKNRLYNKSLPISVFDYIACGRPIIFTDLDSLTQYMESKNFITFINPDNLSGVISFINKRLIDPIEYENNSKEARMFFEEYYNWEKIENLFIERIKALFND